MIDAARTQRGKILQAIEDAGVTGATDYEIEELLGMRAQSVSPRRGELVQLGLIADSGQKRPTPSGRSAIVWVQRSLTGVLARKGQQRREGAS